MGKKYGEISISVIVGSGGGEMVMPVNLACGRPLASVETLARIGVARIAEMAHDITLIILKALERGAGVERLACWPRSSAPGSRVMTGGEQRVLIERRYRY